MESVIRYVVTYKKPEGLRTLCGPAQGRFTHETQEQAQAMLDATLRYNSAQTLEQIGYVNMEVRACPCYPGHFDPMRVYFD